MANIATDFDLSVAYQLYIYNHFYLDRYNIVIYSYIIYMEIVTDQYSYRYTIAMTAMYIFLNRIGSSSTQGWWDMVGII